MSHVAISVMAPIREGRRDALAEVLAGLPAGPGSPLSHVAGLHVGRFTVVDRLDPAKPSQPPNGPYLYFAADLDGPFDAAVTSIATHCGDLFRHCEGCPDTSDSRAFDEWLIAHRIKDGFTIMPYAGHTLDEVLDGLDARARLGHFAVDAQRYERPTIRQRFLEEFGT